MHNAHTRYKHTMNCMHVRFRVDCTDRPINQPLQLKRQADDMGFDTTRPCLPPNCRTNRVGCAKLVPAPMHELEMLSLHR